MHAIKLPQSFFFSLSKMLIGFVMLKLFPLGLPHFISKSLSNTVEAFVTIQFQNRCFSYYTSVDSNQHDCESSSFPACTRSLKIGMPLLNCALVCSLIIQANQNLHPLGKEKRVSFPQFSG